MENYVTRCVKILEESQDEIKEKIMRDVNTIKAYLITTISSGWCTEGKIRILKSDKSDASIHLDWVAASKHEIEDMLKDISRIAISQEKVVYNYRRRQLSHFWETLLLIGKTPNASPLVHKVTEIEEMAKQYEIIAKAKAVMK